MLSMFGFCVTQRLQEDICVDVWIGGLLGYRVFDGHLGFPVFAHLEYNAYKHSQSPLLTYTSVCFG